MASDARWAGLDRVGIVLGEWKDVHDYNHKKGKPRLFADAVDKDDPEDGHVDLRTFQYYKISKHGIYPVWGLVTNGVDVYAVHTHPGVGTHGMMYKKFEGLKLEFRDENPDKAADSDDDGWTEIGKHKKCAQVRLVPK